MSVAGLSQIQFATVALFHFLFVPLTLGLSVLVAIMETAYARTGNEIYLRMTRYWSRLLIINFAVGVVTGITLEFQFGMNWAEYSRFVGDIFGAPLAIEATVAFFLESTIMGLWLFSWKRVSRGVHATLMWLIALASTLSAVWILVANGWMQHPVGYQVVGGKAELTSFVALITNHYALVKIFHTLSSAYTLSCFFIMGISAIQLLQHRHEEMFTRSFKIAATIGIVTSIFIIVAGDLSGTQVALTQPTKLAAMEAQWETETGASYYILQFPDVKQGENSVQAIGIPKGLSILAYRDPGATIKGLNDFPASDRPSVMISFLSFRLMVGLGFLFVLLAFIAVLIAWRRRLGKNRWFLWVMAVAIVLPYLASELGWMLAEMGRQPWIVYGLMRTADAASRSLTPGDVLGSLIAFLALYSILAVVDVFLLSRYARTVED
ncbi:MAG TPA: cytochrome ubiquinol oxidase subunit I [Spirochaetia bacterium]|nr:cytochrome ubiquinol oxidase subunit I [Spirochaetia bacterium]